MPTDEKLTMSDLFEVAGWSFSAAKEEGVYEEVEALFASVKAFYNKERHFHFSHLNVVTERLKAQQAKLEGFAKNLPPKQRVDAIELYKLMTVVIAHLTLSKEGGEIDELRKQFVNDITTAKLQFAENFIAYFTGNEEAVSSLPQE